MIAPGKTPDRLGGKKPKCFFALFKSFIVDYRTVLPTLYPTIFPINPVACSVPSAPL
jgi:hypothetical protein